MKWPRLVQTISVCNLLVGGSAIWYAFQRQMCTMVGGGTNQCSPNVVYLILGVLTVCLGLTLLLVLRRRT